MLFFRIAHFYQISDDEDIERFENALDVDDHKAAMRVVDTTLSQHERSALRVDPDYLSLPPQVGDMVYVQSIGRYAKLLSISDDLELAIVREEFGCYPVKYSDIKRVR